MSIRSRVFCTFYLFILLAHILDDSFSMFRTQNFQHLLIIISFQPRKFRYKQFTDNEVHKQSGMHYAVKKAVDFNWTCTTINLLFVRLESFMVDMVCTAIWGIFLFILDRDVHTTWNAFQYHVVDIRNYKSLKNIFTTIQYKLETKSTNANSINLKYIRCTREWVTQWNHTLIHLYIVQIAIAIHGNGLVFLRTDSNNSLEG